MQMAVEAVIGEPVSVSEFPVSWENTGKFSGFMSIDSTDTRIRGMGVAAITAGNSLSRSAIKAKPDGVADRRGPAPSVSHVHL